MKKPIKLIFLLIYFNYFTGNWEHWKKRVQQYKYPSDAIPEYASILVPNVDNVRTDFLIQTIAKQQKVWFKII